jgi:hypothetical protein
VVALEESFFQNRNTNVLDKISYFVNKTGGLDVFLICINPCVRLNTVHKQSYENI